MHHVAIMNKSWKLIPKILSGEKKIESRWYQTRRAPWNKIHKGDVVYFKNSAEAITASAEVFRVLQFSFSNKSPEKSLEEARLVVKKYGKEICIVNPDPSTWGKVPRYCILIFLKNPASIKQPFKIHKKGFGSAAAWPTMKNIKEVRAR